MIRKIAQRFLKRSQERVDLIAAVSKGRLQKVSDNLHFGRDPKNWTQYRKGQSFELYQLNRVPLPLAENLIDHNGGAGFSFRNDKEAWDVAKQYADKKPFFSQ